MLQKGQLEGKLEGQLKGQLEGKLEAAIGMKRQLWEEGKKSEEEKEK